MNPFEEAERIRVAVGEELDRAAGALESIGLMWSEPKLIWRGKRPDEKSAEIRVDFYKDLNIEDVFEFFICEGGAMSVSEDEVRRWIREHVPDVVRKQRERSA